MKTSKIRVNKTPEKPEGVEIDIVVPDGALESRLLGYLLVNAVREAKHDNRIPYKLPAAFTIEHRGEGTFAVMGTPPPPDTAAPVRGGGYYQPPKPLAIVGIRAVGQTFELIHAELNREALQRAAQAKAAAGEQATGSAAPSAQQGGSEAGQEQPQPAAKGAE